MNNSLIQAFEETIDDLRLEYLKTSFFRLERLWVLKSQINYFEKLRDAELKQGTDDRGTKEND
jgi:hypothetical protein